MGRFIGGAMLVAAVFSAEGLSVARLGGVDSNMRNVYADEKFADDEGDNVFDYGADSKQMFVENPDSVGEPSKTEDETDNQGFIHVSGRQSDKVSAMQDLADEEDANAFLEEDNDRLGLGEDDSLLEKLAMEEDDDSFLQKYDAEDKSDDDSFLEKFDDDSLLEKYEREDKYDDDYKMKNYYDSDAAASLMEDTDDLGEDDFDSESRFRLRGKAY